MYIQVRIRIHCTEVRIQLSALAPLLIIHKMIQIIHANKHYLITQLIGEQVILYINVTVACIPFFKSFLVKQGIIFAAHQMIIICHVPALVSVRRT